MALEKNIQAIDHNTLTKFKDFVNFANKGKIPLMMGSDTNGYHIIPLTKKQQEGGFYVTSLMNLNSQYSVENTAQGIHS